MKLKIVGKPLPNIPWQPRAAGNSDLLWRYDQNPVIGRRPLPHVTGIYNSAVVPSSAPRIAPTTIPTIGLFNLDSMLPPCSDWFIYSSTV